MADDKKEKIKDNDKVHNNDEMTNDALDILFSSTYGLSPSFIKNNEV